MIKYKDPWLARINVAVPGFLSGSPLKGTQDVELTTQQVPDLIQAKEVVKPSNEEPEVQVGVTT